MEEPNYLKEIKEMLSNKIQICGINNKVLLPQNKFKMVIVVRKDLKMSTGKIAAQVAHAVLNCYKEAMKVSPDYVYSWESDSGSTKIVLQISGLDELLKLRDNADKLNIPTSLISDAGRTEVEPGTMTVCAFGPVPIELMDKVTGHLSSYRDE